MIMRLTIDQRDNWCIFNSVPLVTACHMGGRLAGGESATDRYLYLLSPDSLTRVN